MGNLTTLSRIQLSHTCYHGFEIRKELSFVSFVLCSNRCCSLSCTSANHQFIYQFSKNDLLACTTARSKASSGITSPSWAAARAALVPVTRRVSLILILCSLLLNLARTLSTSTASGKKTRNLHQCCVSETYCTAACQTAGTYSFIEAVLSTTSSSDTCRSTCFILLTCGRSIDKL